MLAGLIFATQEAEDRPGVLAATLPFAAATLIEYQARLLLACDAAQIVVIVAQLTPELSGAIARIGRRGVAVDTARTAAEALARLHPLARVMMIADGLVTTEGVVRALAGEGDALLVVPGSNADPAFERVGGGAAWAGVARIDARRLADASALPEDYDLQSTLLRAADQAGARHVSLRIDDMELGHGIERRASALEDRGRAVLSASMAMRPSWFERAVLRPLARLAIPQIARRNIATAAVAAGGGAVAVLGLAMVTLALPAIGLLAVLAGVLTLELAGALALFRDEPMLRSGSRVAILALPGVAALVLAQAVDHDAATTAARLLALGAIVTGAVGERAAAAAARRGWWGTAPGYLALLTLATLAGLPVAGLAATALYAAATLVAAVEALRRQA